MTADDLCEYLKINYRTFMRHMREDWKTLPHTRSGMGRAYHFNKSDVIQFFDTYQKES